MPPKGTKQTGTAAAEKRARSTSTSRGTSPAQAAKTADSIAASDKKLSAAVAAPVVAKRIANRTSGPLKRCAWALEQLSTKKSKDEIWSELVPFQRLTANKDFDAANMVKLVTWNVAGLRGILKKDENCVRNLLEKEGIDVLCLQETKLNWDDSATNEKLGVVPGYDFVDHACAVKKGYSGVRTYVKKGCLFAQPSAGPCVTTGMNLPTTPAATPEHEGRILTVFGGCGQPGQDPTTASPSLALINTYVPNSGMTLDRLEYRTQTFDVEFRKYFKELDALCETSAKQQKAGEGAPVGVVWAGDLNVAEKDYDRYYAGTFKSMQECSGFTPEERASFRETLKTCDAVDALRALYPTAAPVDTFWSMRIKGREKGLGWRIDYFVLSKRLMPLVVDCFAMPQVMGSDHCPLQLWLRTKAL